MTPAMRSILTLPALALGLAACDSAPEPSAARPATQAATTIAPAEPQGPVTRFDGRYVGKLTLSPDRTLTCPKNEGNNRVLTVRQGRASLLVVPESRLTLHGNVRPDGSLAVHDMVDRSITVTGSFDERRFDGLYRNGVCRYSVQLTRRD